jgi:hypothetical protein
MCHCKQLILPSSPHIAAIPAGFLLIFPADFILFHCFPLADAEFCLRIINFVLYHIFFTDIL